MENGLYKEWPGEHTGQETCTHTVTNVPLWIFTLQTVFIEYITSVKW
jgi:hypothetical protein